VSTKLRSKHSLGEDSSGEVCLASIGVWVNTAVSLFDLEETGFSPSSAPWVSNEPVVETRGFVSSPSDDLDGMSTFEISSDVLIDSTLVVVEVTIDAELSFNGSVGLHSGLDFFNCAVLLDCVGLALILVSKLSGALLNISSSWGVGEWSIRDSTSASKILPGVLEISSLASVVVTVARY
jgi:hypothetical protein